MSVFSNRLHFKESFIICALKFQWYKIHERNLEAGFYHVRCVGTNGKYIYNSLINCYAFISLFLVIFGYRIDNANE